MWLVTSGMSQHSKVCSCEFHFSKVPRFNEPRSHDSGGFVEQSTSLSSFKQWFIKGSGSADFHDFSFQTTKSRIYWTGVDSQRSACREEASRAAAIDLARWSNRMKVGSPMVGRRSTTLWIVLGFLHDFGCRQLCEASLPSPKHPKKPSEF